MSPNARDELAALGLDGGPRQPNNANYPGHKGNKQKRTRPDHRGTNQGNGVYTKLRTLPPEHLFTLRQSLVGYRFYQQLISEVDQELELRMHDLPRAEGAPEQMQPRTKACVYQRAGNEPAFDLKAELFRVAGVDLTDVPGISAITAHTILMEVGPDVSRFRNASAFASWLGLCPEKQVSGGKTLSTDSRKVKNRAAIALRLGAHCLYRAKNYLREFHRRMKWRLGAPGAVTATAHKGRRPGLEFAKAAVLGSLGSAESKRATS